MKHHKARDVWAHKPDAVPLEDKPSMGPKRKKGSLKSLSRKHLWDKLHQAHKELRGELVRLQRNGIPTKHVVGPWGVSIDCDFGIWSMDYIIKSADSMVELIEELEWRMD